MPRSWGAPEGCPDPVRGALPPAQGSSAWHGRAALGASVLAPLRVLVPVLPSLLPET